MFFMFFYSQFNVFNIYVLWTIDVKKHPNVGSRP